MTAVILTLCATVHLLCWLFFLLHRLDQRGRRERLEERMDGLRNRAR